MYLHLFFVIGFNSIHLLFCILIKHFNDIPMMIFGLILGLCSDSAARELKLLKGRKIEKIEIIYMTHLGLKSQFACSHMFVVCLMRIVYKWPKSKNVVESVQQMPLYLQYYL